MMNKNAMFAAAALFAAGAAVEAATVSYTNGGKRDERVGYQRFFDRNGRGA